MQLESGNNVNNFQLSIWLILGEPGEMKEEERKKKKRRAPKIFLITGRSL